MQEGDDGVFVRIGGIPTELVFEHDVDRVAQGLGRAVVQIGCSQCGHAQARHLEAVLVCAVAGDIITPQVGLADIAALSKIVVDDAKGLEHVATDRGALMAGYAAIAFEQVVAALFLGADGRGVTV